MSKSSSHIAGIVLAAGYGERMIPLTRTLPKPLLPILGHPLFEITVRKLLRAGASAVHANLHHLPEAFERFAEDAALPVVFHREREILGTAGGIGGMIPAIEGAECVLLHNGDIVADIDFARVLEFHNMRRPLVTLVLLPEGPRANVAVANGGEVSRIGGVSPSGDTVLGYAGMAILSAESFPFFPRGRNAGLVDTLNAMIERRPGSVVGWNAGAAANRYAWGDCGSPAGYLEVNRRVLVEKTAFDPLIEPPPYALFAAPDSVIDAEALLRGFCAIGRRATIGKHAALENCVVLDDTRVASGARHQGEILFPGGSLKG